MVIFVLIASRLERSGEPPCGIGGGTCGVARDNPPVAPGTVPTRTRRLGRRPVRLDGVPRYGQPHLEPAAWTQ